ncbi:hypothetical protein DERP_007368 [Dermatophagoides pteronyssinus]|uniref:Uncharacterized protein n=1 Tax=Dermatophagoides pteronyssinus TaxID=6956 RepID=A0ABQ8J4E3_DERPT|nr:hypothetical protein DERP_007368 [Dermatophagoides pteronyssinus]
MVNKKNGSASIQNILEAQCFHSWADTLNESNGWIIGTCSSKTILKKNETKLLRNLFCGEFALFNNSFNCIVFDLDDDCGGDRLDPILPLPSLSSPIVIINSLIVFDSHNSNNCKLVQNKVLNYDLVAMKFLVDELYDFNSNGSDIRPIMIEKLTIFDIIDDSTEGFFVAERPIEPNDGDSSVEFDLEVVEPY